MGNIKNLVVNFIGRNKLIIAGLSLILILLLLNRWNYNRYWEAKQDNVRAQANLKATQDTLRVSRSKDNSVEYNKLSYIAKDLQDLKQLNQDLQKQVEITNGKVATIEKIGFITKTDTIRIPTKGVVRDSVVYLSSHFDTTYSPGNYRSLALESSYSLRNGLATGLLTKDEIAFTATVGLKQVANNSYEIFVRPAYPNMKVTSLEGAIIQRNFFEASPKTKIPLITIGGAVGWTPFTYDLNTQKPDFNFNRVGVSIGLNFNLAAMLRK
jgi:hypothetical protein